MKNKSFPIILISAVLAMGSLLTTSVRAEKMDAETHTIVIEKMESVLKSGREDETLKLYPVRARLADLYAERARIRAMDEAAKSCQKCTGATDDRKRAIELYKKVLVSAPKEEAAAVVMQMAHIYDLLGESNHSIQLYESIIRAGERNSSRKLVAQSYAALAEAQFSKADFGNALKNFKMSVQLSEPSRRGYLTYRISWCYLNLGDQSKAVETLVKLLRSPELLTRESTSGPVLDESFQEDASRDLATFLCRGTMESNEMKLLESVSPNQAQRDNLHYLASECERLGNKKAALQAWSLFIEHEKKPTDRLEAMVRVAQIRFDLGQKPEALAQMTTAINAWKKTGCKDDAICSPLKMRIRKIVTDWNRVEKKKLTPGVLQAYQVYLSKFDDDTEMTFWAALVARDLKESRTAATLYHQSSILAYNAKSDKAIQSDKELAKSNAEILEGSLVGEIEMAELAKDATLRENAYTHYLKLNPNGKMATNVRYQRAHLAYEHGDMKLSIERFNEFVASSDCVQAQKGASNASSELCVKAADLTLDALVTLKDDRALEQQALKYSTLVPSRKDEYLRIARKSALNQVATATNNTKSSSGEIDQALAKLATVSLVGASESERVVYWKNRLILAEKAKNLDETDKAADGLLGVKGLSENDREFALARKSWSAEMRMDFGKAYAIAKNLSMPDLAKDERVLRLALLAELAGKDPRTHEEEYLRLHPSGLRSALIRAKLVRQARSPLKELKNGGRELERFPQVYAPLVLEIYARTNDTQLAEHAIKVKGVVSEPAGMAIARHLFLHEFDGIRIRLTSHKIRANSDALLNRTLTERLNLLNQADQAAGRAVRTHDWTLQLVTLSVLSSENKRLYNDILTLPTPRNLKAAQKAQYTSLIAQKAQPYFDKHKQIEAKLTAFWNDSEQFSTMTEDFEKARPEFRPLLAKDLEVVARVAPEQVRSKLESALATGTNVPSERQVSAAREDVRSGPFSTRRLKTLKELEEKRGSDTMVTYLDARLLKLQQGGK